jgi:hypothetical protein
MKFKYRNVPDSTMPTGIRKIPLLPVKLFVGNRETIIIQGLLDTGAEDCMFPLWCANELGIDLKSGTKKEYEGIGGYQIPCYLHNVKLQVIGFQEKINMAVGFTEFNRMPLIGQAGFFDNYQVTFERYNGRFEVISKSHYNLIGGRQKTHRK